MLDFDLAILYNVETRALKQAVKRNTARFPPDFMFELRKAELQELITICDNLPPNIKYSPAMPYAFTEAGVAMLSSVLNSERAILVNIEIIRVFTRLRQLLHENIAVRLEIEQIKKKLEGHDQNITLVFRYLDELLKEKTNPAPRKRIGFKPTED